MFFGSSSRGGGNRYLGCTEKLTLGETAPVKLYYCCCSPSLCPALEIIIGWVGCLCALQLFDLLSARRWRPWLPAYARPHFRIFPDFHFRHTVNVLRRIASVGRQPTPQADFSCQRASGQPRAAPGAQPLSERAPRAATGPGEVEQAAVPRHFKVRATNRISWPLAYRGLTWDVLSRFGLK